MTYEQLITAAKEAYEASSPAERLELDADQAVSFAYHCAKSFRAQGGTYDEFVRRYGAELKQRYLATHGAT